MGTVIGILPEDDRLDLGIGREVQSSEHLVGGRVDRPTFPFGGHELLEVRPVGLHQLLAEDRVPVGLGHAPRAYAVPYG
jgi:hypothetical protein